MIAGVCTNNILTCHLRLLIFKLTSCADEAGELFRAILEPSARAVSILPSHPEFNAHWIMIQLKLHPAVVISCTESTPLEDGTITKSTYYSNPSGAEIEVEAYLSLSEVELYVEIPSIQGLHVKVLPLPTGWPKRPDGGFENDSQGFGDESNESNESL